MRKIKFRGQRQSDNKWIYGDLLQPVEICDIYEISDCESIDGSRYDVVEDTIGQFTGLKDKNGKDIYEGDIVKFKMYDGNYENYYIVFRNVEFEAINKNDSNFIGFEIWETEGEVIGNIYENPELLEDK